MPRMRSRALPAFLLFACNATQVQADFLKDLAHHPDRLAGALNQAKGHGAGVVQALAKSDLTADKIASMIQEDAPKGVAEIAQNGAARKVGSALAETSGKTATTIIKGVVPADVAADLDEKRLQKLERVIARATPMIAKALDSSDPEALEKVLERTDPETLVTLLNTFKEYEWWRSHRLLLAAGLSAAVLVPLGAVLLLVQRWSASGTAGAARRCKWAPSMRMDAQISMWVSPRSWAPDSDVRAKQEPLFRKEDEEGGPPLLRV